MEVQLALNTEKLEFGTGFDGSKPVPIIEVSRYSVAKTFTAAFAIILALLLIPNRLELIIRS